MNVVTASRGLGRASMSLYLEHGESAVRRAHPWIGESWFPALTAEVFYWCEREQRQGHWCESEQCEFSLRMCTSYLHSSASDKTKQVGSFLLQVQAIFYYIQHYTALLFRK